jgi:glycosyltransferase involved in cell wall biosynthesis
MKPTISILMSTYNGELYLHKQIESILNQTVSNFSLIIRDDGSKDQTKEIIKSYTDSRIKILEFGDNIGIVRSFSKLLESQESDYFFFCDQDDIWNSTKIDDQIKLLRQMEESIGKNKPCMTFSDLSIIDSNDKPINESLWKYGKINPSRNSINYLLVQPIVTGCAMAGNKSLSSLMRPIPVGVFMHDWWASIVASYFGAILPYEKSTIQYRVHFNNRLGMSEAGFWNSLVKFKLNNYKEFYNATIDQAKEFTLKYKEISADSNFQIIREFSTIKDRNRIQRILILNKHNIQRSSIFRNIFYNIYTFIC